MKTVTIKGKKIKAYSSMAEMLNGELKHTCTQYGGAIPESQIVMQVNLDELRKDGCLKTTDRTVIHDGIEYAQYRFRTGEFLPIMDSEGCTTSDTIWPLVLLKSSAEMDTMHCVYIVEPIIGPNGTCQFASTCTFKHALESYDGDTKYTYPHR